MELARRPADDSQFLSYVQHPELAELLPVLYPGVFPNLAKLTAARADLVAILLTGLPAGIVPGFQNYTGSTYADELRLNMAIPPSSKPEPARPDRRRPGRLPERPPGVRRRHLGGAASDRRRHLPAGEQELQARRGGGAADRRADRGQHQLPAAASRISARRRAATTRRRCRRSSLMSGSTTRQSRRAAAAGRAGSRARRSRSTSARVGARW